MAGRKKDLLEFDLQIVKFIGDIKLKGNEDFWSYGKGPTKVVHFNARPANNDSGVIYHCTARCDVCGQLLTTGIREGMRYRMKGELRKSGFGKETWLWLEVEEAVKESWQDVDEIIREAQILMEKKQRLDALHAALPGEAGDLEDAYRQLQDDRSRLLAKKDFLLEVLGLTA